MSGIQSFVSEHKRGVAIAAGVIIAGLGITLLLLWSPWKSSAGSEPTLYIQPTSSSLNCSRNKPDNLSPLISELIKGSPGGSVTVFSKSNASLAYLELSGLPGKASNYYEMPVLSQPTSLQAYLLNNSNEFMGKINSSNSENRVEHRVVLANLSTCTADNQDSRILTFTVRDKESVVNILPTGNGILVVTTYEKESRVYSYDKNGNVITKAASIPVGNIEQFNRVDFGDSQGYFYTHKQSSNCANHSMLFMLNSGFNQTSYLTYSLVDVSRPVLSVDPGLFIHCHVEIPKTESIRCSFNNGTQTLDSYLTAKSPVERLKFSRVENGGFMVVYSTQKGSNISDVYSQRVQPSGETEEAKLLASNVKNLTSLQMFDIEKKTKIAVVALTPSGVRLYELDVQTAPSTNPTVQTTPSETKPNAQAQPAADAPKQPAVQTTSSTNAAVQTAPSETKPNAPAQPAADAPKQPAVQTAPSETKPNAPAQPAADATTTKA